MMLARISSSISVLLDTRISPVSLSTTSLAVVRPSRYSTGTSRRLNPDFSSRRTCLAVIRRPSSAITSPFLSLISNVATSPLILSGIKSIDTVPSAFKWKTLLSKNISRMSSLLKSNAWRIIVAGNFRRRSIRANTWSFGSNSKSSQEPR